ncbi:AlkA N-terminal domain-containing protein [Streptomyces sp. NPDC051162]|uniref:AlkA N-terminal domain-containing protein n=1 Tax=unclassified Streptomyces TaxID=2593676 RepID=UPI0034490D4D
MEDTPTSLDDSRYQAVCSRDARFDGEFFFGVASTGIYCRPSCPAVTPKRGNVSFHASAAAAQGAGFRACRRCRPDAVPGSAEWNVRADLVGRAMRLIGDGIVDRAGVEGLADRLGYSARQVHRQLTAELGAGPVALARAQRAHTARILLTTTSLPVTEIAFAAGFKSVRQFNDTVRQIYACTPTALRGRAPGRRGGPAPTTAAGIPLRLAHRGPYAAREIFDDLHRSAVPGIEEVRGTPGARLFRRTLRLPYGTAVAEVREPAPAHHGQWLDCHLHLSDPRDLAAAVQRVRRLFDLDADPYAVAGRLRADPLLRPLVDARPGLRSPGAADGDELAVRAVLARGRTAEEAAALAGGLVSAYGKPLAAPDGALTHVFPGAGTLAGAALDDVPEPARRALRALTTALAEGAVRLDPGADRDAAERALLTLPGIDARTAGHIRMRALGDPDVFLAEDAEDTGTPVEDTAAWRPWRSYALHHLRLRAAEPRPDTVKDV